MFRNSANLTLAASGWLRRSLARARPSRVQTVAINNCQKDQRTLRIFFLPFFARHQNAWLYIRLGAKSAGGLSLEYSPGNGLQSGFSDSMTCRHLSWNLVLLCICKWRKRLQLPVHPDTLLPTSCRLPLSFLRNFTSKMLNFFVFCCLLSSIVRLHLLLSFSSLNLASYFLYLLTYLSPFLLFVFLLTLLQQMKKAKHVRVCVCERKRRLGIYELKYILNLTDNME